MRDIGKNIKTIRQKKNMTQEALGDALFVTRQTVSNYENGRSRPDLDMLLKIAEVLETDVNAILYGPPVPPSKKKAWKWGLISFGLTLFCLLSYVVIEPLLRSLYARIWHTGIGFLRYLITELLLPLALFFLGWALLHWLSIFSGLRQLQGKKAMAGKIILLIVGGLCLLVPLPFLIWQGVGAVRMLTADSVSMTFPYIPVYTEILRSMILLSYKAPFVYCILGGFYWLFWIPSKKSQL